MKAVHLDFVGGAAFGTAVTLCATAVSYVNVYRVSTAMGYRLDGPGSVPGSARCFWGPGCQELFPQ
jgi:hypothetical protein